MKRFLIILFLGYVSSDKLDLTYLPPPGSQYAGGRPEDIQTPLEYPKETYSTTLRPSVVTIGPKVPNPDDYEATIGIDRIAPVRIQASFPAQGSNAPFNNYQNSFNVPSTTVSYAFTQTTTHPPSESFETTLSPINPITGFPTTGSFNVPSQKPSQIYRGNNNQFPPNAAVYQQYNTGDQSMRGSIAQFPGSSFPSSNYQFNGEQNLPGQSQFQQGFQQPDSGRRLGFIPEGPFQRTQNPRNQSLIGGFNSQPGLISSTNAPQGQTSGFYPSNNRNNLQGFTTAIPDLPQASISSKLTNVYQPDIKIQSQNKYPTLDDNVYLQQYPGYSDSTAQVYQPTSTVAPTISFLGFANQQFSAGDFSSPVNFLDTDQGRIGTKKYFKRPERPQAETDRNAVILNYKNVITPEGYEYSFDTSNGIHADENGTAVGGVKAEGSYSYTGDDGKVYTVVYTADENGFQPRGDHLPTPPPVPEAIQRLIEKAKQDKEAGIFDDGLYDEGKYGYKKYQGADSLYPQGSDRITPSGIRVPDRKDNYSPTSQSGPKNQFTAYQPGTKKPTKDFDDLSETQEQIKDDRLVEDEIRRPNNIKPYSRPVNRIYNKSMAEQYSKKQTSDNKTLRRPAANIEVSGNQDEFYYDNDKNQINNQRPSGSQYPSENNDQYIDELSTGVKRKPENNSFKNISNKGVSQRPSLLPQQQQIEADRIRKPGSSFNQDRDENNRQKIKARPFNGISQDNIQTMFDELENERRLSNRLPSRRPTDQSVTDKDGFESPVFNQNGYRNESRTDITSNPNRVLSKYPTETTELTSDENFTSSSEIPFRFRPNGMNRPIIKTNAEQEFSTRRRLSRPGLKVDNETSDNQGSIDDISTTYGTEDDAANIDSYTTPVPKDRTDNTQGFEPQSSQQSVTKRPQSFITKYSSPRDKLQRPQPSYQNERINGQRLENVKYGQRLRDKPTVSSSTNIQENNKKVFNSTGYQYIPPKNRFNFDEENNYSTINPGAGTNTIRKPSQQLTQYKSKNAIAKPFMTPNVSRVETKNREDDYDEIVGIDNERLNQQRYEENPKVVNYEQYTTPDQIFSDEVISSENPSIQSTLRPTLQTTRKSQFNQQYPKTPGYKTTSEDFQKKFDGKDSSTQTPYKLISSTTPVTGRPSYYTTPKETLTPGQKNVYDFDGTDRLFNIASPTTPPSSQSSDYGGYYPEGITENQYQTTYRPNLPTTTNNHITASGLPNTGPTELLQTRPKATQTIYGNQFPSTTYGPNYTIKGNEVFSGNPGSQLDDFGKPVVNYEENVYKEEYTPVSDSSSPVNNQNTRYQYGPKGGRPNKPDLDQNPDFMDYQTTTDRTNGRPVVNIEEQGYKQQYTPSFDGRSPADNLNTRYQYGPKGDRPNKPGLGQNPDFKNYQTTTDRINGRPVVNIEEQQQYTPSSDGRSSVDNQNTRYQYGPNINGLNKTDLGQNPVVQSYPTSTEQVIGEDFSGPKQQQRFDPKLGYYY